MSAATLLAELNAAGVRLSLAGDDLRYQTRPGVIIAPYRERIATHKLALRKALLQVRIIEAVTVEPQNFDRAAYDALWTLWHAQDAPKEESTP